MYAKAPLLVAQQGKTGTFTYWLNKLGLEDFIKRYPIEKLVEWGWLIPQHRVVFPKDFFLTWDDFPCLGTSFPSELDEYSELWDSTWIAEPNRGELWPLHPFFHPDNKSAAILGGKRQYKYGPDTPEVLEHPNGYRIKPYADFLFHWQAYALIDVIRFADCIEPILHTPDVVERAQGVLRIAEHLHQHADPSEILNIETRWGGLSKVMTWISHYRSFADALDAYHFSKSTGHAERLIDRKSGATALAKILGVTAESLAIEIKDRLLILANDWISQSPKTSRWTKKAWPHLQKDISLATIWLCHLSDRTFESYMLEWRYKSNWGDRWAQLSDVLPWEFWAARNDFLRLAPVYMGETNLGFTEEDRFSENAMSERVDTLRNRNYPFQSFIGAFKSLHDDLGKTSFNQLGENFRDRRPLDYYALLAIRAEAVLSYAVDKSNPSEAIANPGLETYIIYLATQQHISIEAIELFKSRELQNLTKLHKRPDQPIRAIMNRTLQLPKGESSRIKSFLCCMLARNYFAHHYYLDGEQLPRSEESAFLLGGIVATVLLLA